MTLLVFVLLVFLAVGSFFLFIHLVIGKMIRPAKPEDDKLTIYECGEPTVGSAWIQFDLRYYVVALLFVIFDVEVAFFFPWAVVFGQANNAGNTGLAVEERATAYLALVPDRPEYRLLPADSPDPQVRQLYKTQEQRDHVRRLLEKAQAPGIEDRDQVRDQLEEQLAGTPAPAQSLGWMALFDILVFFGVLLVGFAYLWKRGDLA